MHVWTAAMLEFNTIPVVFQLAKWIYGLFKEITEEMLYTEVKMTSTSDGIRADQTTLNFV